MKLTGMGKALVFLFGLALVLTAAHQFLPANLRTWDGVAARLRGTPSAQPGLAVSSTAAVATPRSAATRAGGAQVILRLHGSNTIGKDLAPALAEALLSRQGATGVHRVPGDADEVSIEAALPAGAGAVAVEVSAHGSSTAFEDLQRGAADIGMASRRIKDEEKARLVALGDMTSAASEHVLGLDGLAVIVNSSNSVDSITVDQLRDVFSGRIADWSELGGSAGAIRLYARDDKSGTYDTFKSLVLEDRTLAIGAHRYEDSRALSRDVAGDVNGIGFIGLAYVGDCRALKVGERGAVAYRPTLFTVRTEDYALSRRLYLYGPSVSSNPWSSRFVSFALSNEGQAIVDSAGFVGQSLAGAKPAQETASEQPLPPEYVRLSRGATRLPLNFRFDSGSDHLDNKALRDVGRLLENLAQAANRDRQVLLFGFADGLGTADVNGRLSRARADAVQRELDAEGVHAAVAAGFGSALPVASNENESGRGRNRRVEVWLR